MRKQERRRSSISRYSSNAIENFLLSVLCKLQFMKIWNKLFLIKGKRHSFFCLSFISCNFFKLTVILRILKLFYLNGDISFQFTNRFVSVKALNFLTTKYFKHFTNFCLFLNLSTTQFFFQKRESNLSFILHDQI